MSVKKRGLGRGLDALLSTNHSQSNNDKINRTSELRKIPVEFLTPGKYQPRKDMSPEALEDLAASVRTQGIIQPIVVRQLGEQRFEIIAGERRWRAAQLASLDVIPCLVKDVPDESAVAIALIENIQREDLNAMEEAQALDRLMVEFSLTHQEVAEAVGKSRTTVTNLMRLNNLNTDVKLLVEHGDIEMGHARALLSLAGDAQTEAAQMVSGRGLTVRDTEKLVKRFLVPAKPVQKKKIDPDVQRLATRISEDIGAPVVIDHNAKGKGKMVFSFTSLDELDGILSKLALKEHE